MIDKETQQKIKDAANIVEVVGDYVKLTRRGANYMGLCPFHNERTPSFSVSPRKNFCHCFSCKKGGSPVNFLMEKEGISYTEALLLLAKKYGIPVQERELSAEERERMSEREAMIVASEWAMNLFHDNLYNTEEGRDIGLSYLYGRGITDEAIRKFRLGYSIDRGDALISKARQEGFDLEVFKKIGLVGTSQSGHDYDKFRGRVMFPIRNASGKPVAFGGRALKGEAAKYINSPETPLYKKSNELYGIYEAKPEIIKSDRVFLMEGYLDVIGSWQASLRNAVASSGTALTESQVSLIHRFTDNVTLIYDGDPAGIKASLRGIDMLLSQKLHVKVLLLPDGDDPDSFARKHTPEEFNSYIETHQQDFINYKLKVLLSNAGNNPQEISEAVRSVVGSIAHIPDEIERISYIKECARTVNIDEKIIAKQVGQAMIGIAGSRKPQEYQDFNSSVRIPSTDNSPSSHSSDSSSSQNKLYEANSSLVKKEREILKYCVRYAFLPISEEETDKTSVLDYVADELNADGIEFTNPDFQRVFALLLQRKELFESAFSSYSLEVEAELKLNRKDFQENLRIKGGSLAKLKKEEEKYSVEENNIRMLKLRKFAIDFSVDFLINHEENNIRNVVNPLITDRHTLSIIYSRNGNQPPTEESNLSVLVPRALSELRGEILHQKVQDLQRQVAEAIRNNDRVAQQDLMGKLSKILYVRSRIAENLGDRIISPK